MKIYYLTYQTPCPIGACHNIHISVLTQIGHLALFGFCFNSCHPDSIHLIPVVWQLLLSANHPDGSQVIIRLLTIWLSTVCFAQVLHWKQMAWWFCGDCFFANMEFGVKWSEISSGCWWFGLNAWGSIWSLRISNMYNFYTYLPAVWFNN